MNADLLAMLGAGGLGGPPPRREPDPGKTIATFKAGKMNPVLQEVSYMQCVLIFGFEAPHSE